MCFGSLVKSSLLCPSDHSGSDQVIRGVHQDAAHRLRGVRSLSEAAIPTALQRPHQVRAHSRPSVLSLTQSDDDLR